MIGGVEMEQSVNLSGEYLIRVKHEYVLLYNYKKIAVSVKTRPFTALKLYFEEWLLPSVFKWDLHLTNWD